MPISAIRDWLWIGISVIAVASIVVIWRVTQLRQERQRNHAAASQQKRELRIVPNDIYNVAKRFLYLYESKSNKENTDKEKEHTTQKRTLRWIKVYTAVTAAIFIAALYQSRISHDTLIEARNTTQQATRQADAAWASMRPFIFVTFSGDQPGTKPAFVEWVREDEAYKFLTVKIITLNYGKGPAIIKDERCSLMWVHKTVGMTNAAFQTALRDTPEEFSPGAVVPADKSENGIRCGPGWPYADAEWKDFAGNYSPTCPEPRSQDQRRRLVECFADLWIAGQVTYSDASGVTHITTFCSKFDRPPFGLTVGGDPAYCNKRE